MKYPQLVSARAVNAISDWLVIRLEQLGVDAPLIYSRLLLSLLHTPLQINALDLAEISDIKIYNTGIRKGNNRRYSSSDTESLKRIAAIESLIDAAAADQQISNIEQLVDDLCEKLREIEKQSSVDDSHKFIRNSPDFETMRNCESPEDPTNRYYRAFPALSAKDLNAKERQSKICMTAPKSLTWPHVSSVVSLGGNRGSSVDNCSSLGFGNTAGVKRKPKRRRNQAISKGKSSYGRKYNISATPNNNNNSGSSVVVEGGGGNTCGGGSGNKNNSILWDTEFEGHWEMGRDLIREFVMKQNNRNRSISESDASKFVEINDMIEAKKRNSECSQDSSDNDNHHSDGTLLLKNMFAAAAANTSGDLPTIEKTVTNNLMETFVIDNAQYQSPAIINDTSILLIGSNIMRNKCNASPDTLTSLTEIDNISAPRRLYERDVSNESINATASAEEDAHHLAQFEAKFNRSVEALWDDDNNNDNNISNAGAAAQPPNNDSFWYNYYKHQYNSGEEDEVKSMQCLNASLTMAPAANIKPTMQQQSNYFIDSSSTISTQYQAGGVGGLASLKDSIWSATDRTDNNLMLQSASSTTNLWDSGVELDHSLQSSQMNIANKLQPNPITHFDEITNFTNTPSYNAPNLLKWSDCSFDTPYTVANTSTAAQQLPSAYNHASLSENNLRKDLFDSQNVNDYKSLPIIQQTDLNTINGGGAIANKWNTSIFEYVKQEEQLNCSENISPNLSSSGTASETTNITLANHSKNSGFIEVSPSSSSANNNNNNNSSDMSRQSASAAYSIAESKQSSNNQNKNKFPRCMQSPVVAAPAEEENLLTSERTHFCPIKQTYTDGYSFEIPSHLDEINYTRSASGSLYLDSAKYMEYNPICNDNDDDTDDDSSDDGLVLKFCVRQIEKCCQTDSNSIDQHYMANRYAMAKQRTTSNCTTAGILSPDIEMDYEMNRLSYDNNNSINVINAEEKEAIICSNLDMETWTMGDGKQKCLNNNNSHALWEHCSACECDIVSMPANRLLKDELSADGDEIMSDLKYMQNLYIGSDWEDDDDCVVEDDDDDDDDDNNNNDDVNENINDNLCQPLEKEIVCNNEDLSSKTESDVFFYNVSKLLSDFLKPETAKSLAHAFVLNDASKPANDTKSTNIDSIQQFKQHHVDAINDKNNNDDDSNNNNNNVSDKYVGGLWGNDNDNSIWRRDNNNHQNTIQANNNIWSTNYVNTKSVAATNSNVAATVAATTTTTTSLANIGNVAIIGNAITSLDDKQYWEHSYLEEIWKAGDIDEDTNVNATNEPIMMMMINENDDAKTVDISRSIGGGGGGSGGGGNCGGKLNRDDTAAAITLFAAAHEQSYDLSNATLQQIKEIGGNNDNQQQTKLNRYDRKRRHSASQNITNLLDPLAAAFLECDAAVGRKISSLYDSCTTAAPSLNVTTTIITCNYWATDVDGNAAAAAYFDNYNNKGMNNVTTTGTTLVNPSLILKSMPMVSRPLTR